MKLAIAKNSSQVMVALALDADVRILVAPNLARMLSVSGWFGHNTPHRRRLVWCKSWVHLLLVALSAHEVLIASVFCWSHLVLRVLKPTGRFSYYDDGFSTYTMSQSGAGTIWRLALFLVSSGRYKGKSPLETAKFDRAFVISKEVLQITRPELSSCRMILEVDLGSLKAIYDSVASVCDFGEAASDGQRCAILVLPKKVRHNILEKVVRSLETRGFNVILKPHPRQSSKHYEAGQQLGLMVANADLPTEICVSHFLKSTGNVFVAAEPSTSLLTANKVFGLSVGYFVSEPTALDSAFRAWPAFVASLHAKELG